MNQLNKFDEFVGGVEIYAFDDVINVVSYQISMYTEAMYMTLPTDIAEEDGLRISRGVEYQIYRAV